MKTVKQMENGKTKKTNNRVIAISITIIVALFLTQIVYGNDFIKGETKQDGFFIVDKTEVTQNGYVTMTIDLSKVNYENFKFTLSANSILEGNISENTENETINQISSNAENNTVTITAKKSELDMDKITLYYKVPNTLAIGSTITLTAKIESLDQTQQAETTNTVSNENELEESNLISNENKINTIANTENNQENTNTVQNTGNNTLAQNYKETTITITVVKTESNNEIEESNNTININNMQTIQNNANLKTTQTTGAQSTSMLSISNSSNNSSKTTTQTYKGSYINYLTNITIDGYSLTPEFDMTNTTYILEVENNVTSLDISTTQYDSTSTVKIYGNTDLKVGQNKILISVTAENGSVRTYRIYVTRKAE